MSFTLRRKGRWLVPGLVVLAVAIYAWQYEAVPEFQTVTVARGDVEATVVAIATLQPRDSVDVGAQVSGQVLRLHVQPGDQVKKGQLLAEIDASLHEATVEADRAALDGLRAELAEQQALLDLAGQQQQRQLRLASEGATREEDVQTAQAEWKAARARLDRLRARIAESRARLRGNEAQLGYSRLYAPISGTVLSVDVKQGQTLNATYQTPTVMRIADLGTMTAWTKVSEADITQLAPDIPLYFTTLGGNGRRWQARVRQVLPAPQTVGGASEGTASKPQEAVQYTVLFDVGNDDGTLLPQMTAQVVFITASSRDVLTAPLEALDARVDDQQHVSARVLDAQGRVQSREVRVGIRNRQLAEVLDGLDEGERLITSEVTRSSPTRFRW